MLIEIKNIYKIYNEGKESEVRALDGVTLSIDRGEFVAIIGASGSGKSTLMNILGCLDVPTYGDYILNGADVTDRTDRQLAHIRNKEIGFIFQGFNLIPALNAWENVELPLIYQGVPASKRADRVEAALERNGLAVFERREQNGWVALAARAARERRSRGGGAPARCASPLLCQKV